MSLRIVFWDVKHGNAAYIKTPNGKHIVCDLGIGSYEGNGEEFSPLLHLKNKYGVEKLNWVIVTHPHKDHINDIMNFDEMSPTTFSRPRHLSEEDIMKDVREQDKELFKKYFEIDKLYSGKIQQDLRLPENTGGVSIETFFPTSCSASNINNHSGVVVISYAESTVIIPGDNESASWKELLANKSFVASIKNADILVAPHHGRDSGYYDELFDHFSPYLTIISDGRFCDTSATDRYGAVTKGWKVHYRNGKSEERKCLTTRNDGYIVVDLGYNNDKKPFISVTAKGK